MFFADWTRPGQGISRCQMDGTNCTAIVRDRLSEPVGLSLDLPSEHVYWWDEKLELLERTDYAGRARHTIRRIRGVGDMAGTYVHPFQLFEQHVLYNSRWSRTADNLNDLLLFHRQRQPDVAHPCREQNNGGCSHLCIPLSRASIVTARCLCPAGWTLVGQQRCQPVQQRAALLFSRREPALVEAVALDASQQRVMVPVVLEYPAKSAKFAIDYNVADGVMYYFRANE